MLEVLHVGAVTSILNRMMRQENLYGVATFSTALVALSGSEGGLEGADLWRGREIVFTIETLLGSRSRCSAKN